MERTMKFKTISKRAAALDNNKKLRGVYPDGLFFRVDYLIGSALTNADDTVYEEKAATEAEHDAIAVSSLELLLGSCSDEEVCSWFRKQGFRW
jgi:hypothetical protein